MEIENASAAQKEKFRCAANALLNNCFLVKKKENTRNDYTFVRQNREDFQQYFELLGYELIVNEEQGVIGIKNSFGTGKLQLGKYESIMLLIFRLLYVEKRRQIGTFTEEVIVLMEEIREKYSMLKIKSKPTMDKTMEKGIIALFKKYNILFNIDADVTQAEARLIIYPSVLLAVPTDDINKYYTLSEEKLMTYAKGTEDGNTEENTDESQID